MLARSIAKSILARAGVKRHHVVPVRMYCERQYLARFGRTRRRPQGRILAYHTVGQPEWGLNDVSPERFRRQIELALSLGYRFVRPSEIALTGGGPMDLAVSFDDGMSSVYTAAAPILREFAVPYAFFPVTGWADGERPDLADKVMSWAQMAELVAEGAEIGSHSVTHPDFGKLPPEQAAEEIFTSRRTMEARLGAPPESFAIPFGQSQNWSAAAREAAKQAGYAIVYAQAEETRPTGTTPRTFVTRLDDDRIFKALLKGKYDSWEEWF